VSGGVIEFATFLAVSYAGCSPSAGGGSATGSAWADVRPDFNWKTPVEIMGYRS